MPWYNISENFDIYVDYKANLLSSEGSDGYKSLARTPTTSLCGHMQYHF